MEASEEPLQLTLVAKSNIKSKPKKGVDVSKIKGGGAVKSIFMISKLQSFASITVTE